MARKLDIHKTLRLLTITFMAALVTPTVSSASSDRAQYQMPVLEFSKDRRDYYVNVSDDAYLRYMWKSFVALNWPASAQRGQPDKRSRKPASSYPVVWETLAKPQQVFLPSTAWGNYPVWEDLTSMPAGLTEQQAKSLCKGFSLHSDIILYDINQPNTSIRSGPVAPLMDQHRRYVRYQVAMNRTLFEYIRKQRYYNADNQISAVRISEEAQFKQQNTTPENAFMPLPFDSNGKPGMLELKSAWRVLDPKHDQAKRYYKRSGFVLSPDRKTCTRARAGLGLVALHIHRLTRLGHVASTFEQVDNVAVLDPANAKGVLPSFNPGTSNRTQTNVWPPYGNRGFQGALPPLITASSKLPPRHQRHTNNISRATEIPDSVRRINREYQQKYIDSPLHYYQIINAQHVRSDCHMRETGHFSKPKEWNSSNCPQPNTTTLINAALESYTQLVNPFTNQPHNYSCQGCHSNARPCGFAGSSKPELTFRSEFMVMSYLLSNAKFPDQLNIPSSYSCNNPATQPPRK
jgi:hypothetical protein